MVLYDCLLICYSRTFVVLLWHIVCSGLCLSTVWLLFSGSSCVYCLQVLENGVHKGMPATIFCTVWCPKQPEKSTIQYFVSKIKTTITLLNVNGEAHLKLPERTVYYVINKKLATSACIDCYRIWEVSDTHTNELLKKLNYMHTLSLLCNNFNLLTNRREWITVNGSRNLSMNT